MAPAGLHIRHGCRMPATGTKKSSKKSSDETDDESAIFAGWVNAVTLAGVVSAVTVRSDADGAETASFRLSVRNPAGGRDTIDCDTSRRALINRLHRVPAEAVVEVQGCLRRTYWRAATGLASRTFVDVTALKRV